MEVLHIKQQLTSKALVQLCKLDLVKVLVLGLSGAPRILVVRRRPSVNLVPETLWLFATIFKLTESLNNPRTTIYVHACAIQWGPSAASLVTCGAFKQNWRIASNQIHLGELKGHPQRKLCMDAGWDRNLFSSPRRMNRTDLCRELFLSFASYAYKSI